MIELIHKYNKSIGIVFLFIAFCFAISGVTVDVISGQSARGNYAVKVNDREFSLGEFRQAEQRIEAQYRQMFGENYAKIAQSIRFNIPQQALDNIVDGELLQEQAAALGFAATESESNEYIVKELFSPDRGGSGFTLDAYRDLLRRTGLTASQFEQTVRTDLVRAALTGFLEDADVVTSHDVAALYRKQETEFSFSVASVSYEKLLSEVPTPSEEELTKYYDRNATDYDLPARVSYDYAVLSPEQFKKDVPVLPQDVELYYTDNAAKYASPDQFKVRSIKLLYPKVADAKKMAAVKEKAQKVYDEAVAMKPFETLVTIYSEDLPTKAAGGLKSWMTKQSAPKEYADAGVFDLQPGAIAKLVEADFGFEIVKLEEKKPEGQRPLEEVKAEIEESLRGQEAPAYAAAKAREIVEQAKKGGDLQSLITSAGLQFESTNSLLGDSADPTPLLRGLTQKVLQLSASEKAAPTVIDLGQLAIVVRVKESLEPSPAPFADVRQKVLDAVKNQAAKSLAEKKVQELLDAAKSAPEADLKTLATTKGMTLEGPFTFTRANPAVSQLNDFSAEMRDAIQDSNKAGILPQRFSTSNGFAVVAVLGVKVPEMSGDQSKLTKYREQAQQEASRKIADQMIALMKTKAEVDFKPSLLSGFDAS